MFKYIAKFWNWCVDFTTPKSTIPEREGADKGNGFVYYFPYQLIKDQYIFACAGRFFVFQITFTDDIVKNMKIVSETGRKLLEDPERYRFSERDYDILARELSKATELKFEDWNCTITGGIYKWSGNPV